MPDPILVGRNPVKLEKLADMIRRREMDDRPRRGAGRRRVRGLLRRPDDGPPRGTPSSGPSPPASTSTARSPRRPNTAEALRALRAGEGGRRQERRRAGQALAARVC